MLLVSGVIAGIKCQNFKIEMATRYTVSKCLILQNTKLEWDEKSLFSVHHLKKHTTLSFESTLLR